ncbi:hypothetical protein D3C80_2161280 [compost metagenome]
MFAAGAVLISALGFQAAGQGKLALMAEIVAKTHGSEGIDFAGRRQPEQMAQADQVQMRIGML